MGGDLDDITTERSERYHRGEGFREECDAVEV
jgi:hypothetical protein